MAYSYRTRFSSSPLMGGMTPAVKWLLIVNTAIFLLSYLSPSLYEPLVVLFGLTPVSVVHLAVWQLFTYMFLHSTAGFTHILFNMLTLWMFGVPLESAWGSRQFLRFYFFCGIGAGVAVVVLNYLLPGGRPGVPTIGASGALYGLLLAFGLVFPDARILFFFLFPIQARVYVWLMAGILLLTTFGSGMGGTVSNIAHLGGLVCGFVYLKMGLSRVRGPEFHPLESIDGWYKGWKLKRAKRKFQVYLKKHGQAPRDDRWVN
ncbi:MAG: rhomboid family intramembrane serine protease [Bryobacteraceae bacterium]|nr:rhomboid family intramembrane serine protease [Bryobacteraceae bacterium]